MCFILRIISFNTHNPVRKILATQLVRVTASLANPMFFPITTFPSHSIHIKFAVNKIHIKVYSTVANDPSDFVGERGGHCLERVKGTERSKVLSTKYTVTPLTVSGMLRTECNTPHVGVESRSYVL